MDRMMEELRHMSVSEASAAGTTSFDVWYDAESDKTLEYSQFADVTPDPGPQSLTFGIPRYDAGTGSVNHGDKSNCITYRWVISERETAGNKVDDDGNGLMDNDDGRVERIERRSGQPDDVQVICTNVPRDGFVIRKRGRRLEITIARKNRTPRQTDEGTNFTTTITHVTYSLKNK
jgi:hypothetical protein